MLLQRSNLLLFIYGGRNMFSTGKASKKWLESKYLLQIRDLHFVIWKMLFAGLIRQIATYLADQSGEQQLICRLIWQIYILSGIFHIIYQINSENSDLFAGLIWHIGTFLPDYHILGCHVYVQRVQDLSPYPLISWERRIKVAWFKE